MTNPVPDELQRLTSNHQALLNVTPEMVMLVDLDGCIEYMNPNCSVFINHLIEREGFEKIRMQLCELIKTLQVNDNKNRSIGVISNLFFECRIAPFAGYKGDKLHWLLLRNPVKKNDSQNEILPAEFSTSDIVGSSREMQNLHSIVTKVASTDTTVLISGESGTGKELVANLLKDRSHRRNKPFLTINCTTITDLLLESELFGYERGSFTGADKQRKGKFEIVDGGTIFLDEIGDISPRMQAALLRVLQNGEITRVGGHTPIKINVRIIAATNRNLSESVQKGTFRLDLFYRLNVINIVLPPLRQRKEDIYDLAQYFIKKYNEIFGKSVDLNPQRTLKKLEKYHWPGNIRELENVIHRAVLMCKKNALSTKDITFDMADFSPKDDNQQPSVDPQTYNDKPLKNIIDQLEKEIIQKKLKADNGNVSKSAESLKISKASLYEKMKRHGISAKSLR